MNTRRTLLKNLGANLRHMMTEDWRNQDERNILGMAGHWLEKLGNDDQLDQTILRLGETQERMIDAERQRDRLTETLRSIKNELGVPQPEYPAPVANAVKIADEALNQPNL